MALNSFEANQGTQSALLTDNTGGVGGTLIPVMKIDTSAQGTAGAIWGGGVTGTINAGSIVVTAGTIVADTIVGGTLQNLVSGTINSATVTGNVGVSSGTINLATISGNLGTLGTIGLATVTGNLGTIGTIGLATISGNVGISSGTINVSTISSLPNIPGGTVNLATVVGFASSGATLPATAYPFVMAGTTAANGTVYGVLVDSSGHLIANINTGTVNVGTIGTLGLGTITGNLGTIGTIGLATVTGNVGMSSGTINVSTISTMPNIPGGTVNLATVTGNLGTIGTIGLATITGNAGMPSGTLNIGTINTGTINLGTFVGKDANGVVQTGNPIVIAGTNSGGSVLSLQVDASGNLKTTGVANGTTVGTINVGTINTGTINTGTINAGTFNTGTIGNGSIVVTAGTITAGTVNTGSFTKISAAPTAGSFTAAGSVVVTGSQLDFAGFDIGGTWVGTVFTEAQIGTSGWFALNNVSNLGIVGTSFTGNGDYFVSMAGVDGARARLTYSSGTMTYNARQSNFFAPVQYILGGTLGNMGSVTNLGQLYNAGTVQNILAGTVTALQNGTITQGTLTLLTTVSNLTNGSIHVTAGTEVITTGTINTGTINVATITAGTINSGTINTGTFAMTAGTMSPIPTIANVTYGTHGTTGVSVFGTLAGGTGSGAGTEIFITSLSLSIPSTGGSQDASIGWGTNGGTFHAGTGLLVRGNFPAGGGIQKEFSPPVSSGTQAQLCLFQAGAGTVDVSVTYFITASSL